MQRYRYDIKMPYYDRFKLLKMYTYVEIRFALKQEMFIIMFLCSQSSLFFYFFNSEQNTKVHS